MMHRVLAFFVCILYGLLHCNLV